MQSPIHKDPFHEQYLDLACYDISKLSNDDYKIICKAMSRMNPNIENGYLIISATTHEKINVSQELYNLLCDIINWSNSSHYFPTNCTKTLDEPESYSCVAYALSHCVGGYSFEEIDSWIRDTYHTNGGVPPQKLGETMCHFWGYDYTPYYDISSIPNDVEWDVARTVAVARTTSGPAHMINIVGRHSNGDFIAQDFSCDTMQMRNIWRGAIMCVFVNTSVDTTYCEPPIN